MVGSTMEISGQVFVILLVCYDLVVPTAVVSPNETLVLPVGASFTLTCSTTGTPPPTVSWSRDGVALEGDGDRVVITDATLSLRDADSTESGEYYCSATSSAGLVSDSVRVLVLNVSQEVTTEAVVREDVVLECSSAIPPGLPVRWTFNDSTLPLLSDKYVVLENGSLLILDVWIEDMGDYTCMVGDVQLTRTLSLTGESLTYL